MSFTNRTPKKEWVIMVAKGGKKNEKKRGLLKKKYIENSFFFV